MENRSTDFGYFSNCIVFVYQTASSSSDDRQRNDATFVRFALEQAEETVHNHDAEYQVHYVEGHALDTGRRGSHIVTGEVGQGRTVLVEGHPEEDHHGEYQAQADDAFFGLSRGQFCHLLVGGSGNFAFVGVNVSTAEGVENDDGSNQ